MASFHGRRAEADLGREINAHLQLLEEKFATEGMSSEEARFAAKRAFGNIEQTKELQRDARSFRWLTGWTLELRLGVRMLVRYPGLTMVGGLAMAFAILVGAGVFEVIKRATDPVLPLPEGEAIVGLTYWDRREDARKPASSYDFLKWRELAFTITPPQSWIQRLRGVRGLSLTIAGRNLKTWTDYPGLDPDLYQLWHSSQTGKYQLNFAGYESPAADRLIEQIRVEYDPDVQLALAHRLHDLIAADQPYTFLVASTATYVLDRRIVIVERDASGEERYRPIEPVQGILSFYFERWRKLRSDPVFGTRG